MIQRIQTLYLLIVSILTFLITRFPVMEITSDENIYSVTMPGASYIIKCLKYNAWPLLALCISIILIALVAVFQFKKRLLQIRLCIFNILLMVGFYIMLGGYYWILKEKFSANEILLEPSVILPAINIILSYLAIRAIRRDEALVRATDRLR